MRGNFKTSYRLNDAITKEEWTITPHSLYQSIEYFTLNTMMTTLLSVVVFEASYDAMKFVDNGAH
uniref:Transmembrane protein n=1 Tax=Heterorhabditis bacteriophora TaxID=37862 RepID=A0A1I7W613_HETBA